MRAYHNDQKIKDKYIQRMKDHIAADELIRGLGFSPRNNKGCAVGCTLNSYNHKQYEVELGIPEWLAHLEDRLFENMSLKKSKTFPLLFLEAVNVGADLEQIKPKFLIYILESTLDTFEHEKYPYILNAIHTVLNLYKSGETDIEKFKLARAAACAASAAVYMAYAAYWGGIAAYAAACALNPADVAIVASPADVAIAANAAANARDVAASKTYEEITDKLLELIRECK